MKAMIFAAGLGSRLYPITQNMPKALIPVCGKPLLEHTILRLKEAGFHEIIINVHHYAEQIIDFLKKNNQFGIQIEISDERDLLRDTGGGIKKAATTLWNTNQPMLIHNVDILSNVNLAEVYDEHHRKASDRLSTLVISRRETYRYLLFDRQNVLCGWTNIRSGQTKPDPDMNTEIFDKYAYAGIQVVSPKIRQAMQNKQEAFPIMDFYLEQCRTEKIVGYVPRNLQILDVGKIEALKKAEDFFANLQPEGRTEIKLTSTSNH